MRPLAIDLFSGLGGWAEGAEAEGYHVRRYDIFDMFQETGTPKPEGLDLVLRDVLTIHGSELADANLIVASPPCQFFSYCAMPWSLAKQRAARTRANPELLEKELALFNACFRIQREACEAAGRHIPMVVENVKGAQPWVGRAAWSFGSYFLWGDIPALMPNPIKATKIPGFRFDGSGGSFQSAAVAQEGVKRPGRTMCYPAGSANPDAVRGRSGKLHWIDEPLEGRQNSGGSWFNIGSPGQKETNRNPVHAYVAEGLKMPRTTSKGSARKAASAKIAKIPFALSSHIARVWKPS